MKQSNLFSKTRKEAPADEVSKNARLLIRAGFIHKEMAGVYSYLPLGLRVLENVNKIIREEMNRIGGVELFMSSIQKKEIWEKTNRWSDEVVDNWFKTKFKSGEEVGLGFTHEEPLTWAMKDHIRSFRDLPVFVYQIQTKFRNEARAKSGLIRCREFLMKDLYSFCRDQKEQDEFYAKAKNAYVKIFERAGVGKITYPTFASGGTFSKYSEEFQTISNVGEDTIYIDEKKKIAVNKEVLNDEVLKDLGLNKAKLVEKKAIEVGNIFSQGTRFSEALELHYLDEKGEKKPVVTGAYGIGPGRLIGAVVEVLSDEKGIVWPKEIAPFAVHLVEINPKKAPAVAGEAEKLYQELTAAGIETLWDDREATVGEKFADADLIGIPMRLIISEKTVAENVVELKNRASEKSEKIPRKEILKSFGC
jgi:prolyl-tRNA synthetase